MFLNMRSILANKPFGTDYGTVVAVCLPQASHGCCTDSVPVIDHPSHRVAGCILRRFRGKIP